MLVDQATIYVSSGKGGDGHVSFRREKFVPKGGPDGGDGGSGGSVYLVASANVDTLLDMASKHHWRAGNGQPGGNKQCTGADGGDLEIRLPVGTLVYDDDSGDLIADLDRDGQRLMIARGGKGGFGNERFKSATNQVPRESTPGGPGEEKTLRLELKLIADVGLVGLPNAGKSTLLSRVSRARPKVADYPFTTLEPNLGIAELPGHRRVVVADIPGLIEGAHQGQGLGVQFLKHIERTRVLVHVIGCEAGGSRFDSGDPASNYELICEELAGYSPELAAKEQVVALNKLDLLPGDSERRAAAVELGEAIGCRVYPISAVSGAGVGELLEACWSAVHGGRADVE